MRKMSPSYVADWHDHNRASAGDMAVAGPMKTAHEVAAVSALACCRARFDIAE